MKHNPSLWCVGLPLLASTLILIGANSVDPSPEQDSDSDGLPDTFERYYFLNPSDPGDALLDYDGDRLVNAREAVLGTDPFSCDTDRDGLTDEEEERGNPLSRFYIQWGSPWFTDGDRYDYARPEYFLGAWKAGGEWFSTIDPQAGLDPQGQSLRGKGGRTAMRADGASTASGWRATGAESNIIESLNVALDRSMLTNNLICAVHYFDGTAGLYVDLLDSDGGVVAEDLYGNLMEGTNAEAILLLDIPTASFTNAAVIRLRRGEPGNLSGVASAEVVVYEGLLYIDEDHDGLDAEAERQFGTSDYSVDSNGDRIGDYEECFHKTNNVVPIDPGSVSPEEDGDDQGKRNGIIYVDQVRGNDNLTGRAGVVAGKHGPKKTVGKGMLAVDEDRAHTLVIKSGIYNENLNIGGKNVRVVIEGKVRL